MAKARLNEVPKGVAMGSKVLLNCNKIFHTAAIRIARYALTPDAGPSKALEYFAKLRLKTTCLEAI